MSYEHGRHLQCLEGIAKLGPNNAITQKLIALGEIRMGFRRQNGRILSYRRTLHSHEVSSCNLHLRLRFANERRGSVKSRFVPENNSFLLA